MKKESLKVLLFLMHFPSCCLNNKNILLSVVENKNAIKGRIDRMLSLTIPKKAKLGIAGLLIITIATAILVPMAKANNPVIITVSMNGEGEYSSIQKAIDDAPEGAIIRIMPGTYQEKLKIGKPLTLEGAGPENTIIFSEFCIAELIEQRHKLFKQFRDTIISEEEKAAKISEFNEEMNESPIKFTMIIKNTSGVVIRNLKISTPAKLVEPEGVYMASGVVYFISSEAEMENCIVTASHANGIHVSKGSDVQIRKCLVGGVWSSGIVVGEKNVPNTNIPDILSCQSKNMHYLIRMIHRRMQPAPESVFKKCERLKNN